MPVQSNPPRRLGRMVASLQSDVWAKLRSKSAYNGITNEVVTSVFSSGLYGVVGRYLPTSGTSKPLHPGDVVQVGWLRGEPVVILDHTAKRAKGVSVEEEGASVVEELFLSGGRIYLRNGDQFADIAPIPSAQFDLNIDQVSWGVGSPDYFAVVGRRSGGSSGGLIAVYRLNRPEADQPFPEGFTIEAEQVALYDLDLDAQAFGTLDVSVPGGSATAPLKMRSSATVIRNVVTDVPNPAFPPPPEFFSITVTATIASRATYAAVGANGDLLVGVTISATFSAVDFDGLVIQTGNVSGSFHLGSMLVNLTRGTVVENRVRAALTSGLPFKEALLPNACHAMVGTIGWSATPNVGPTGDPGDIAAVLSLSSNAAGFPTLNNAAMQVLNGVQLAAAVHQACWSPRENTLLKVIGEFPQTVVSIPNASFFFNIPIFQGSRTHVLWNSPLNSLVFLRDLRTQAEGQVGTAVSPALQAAPTKRTLYCVRSGLVFSPGNFAAPVPPDPPEGQYNDRFFVDGASGDEINVDQTALSPIEDLAVQGSVKNAEEPLEIDIVLNGSGVDVQSVNSPDLLPGQDTAEP